MRDRWYLRSVPNGQFLVSSLTFDLRLRHGSQALEIHRRLDAGSPPSRLLSSGGEVDVVPGSTFGKSGRGGTLLGGAIAQQSRPWWLE